jgi:hypothetical protein
MKSFSAVFSYSLLLCGAALSGGCHTHKVAYVRPEIDAPQSWLAPSEPGRIIRRVAILPAYHPRLQGEVLRDIDVALNEELSKKAVFEVVSITRSDMELLTDRREISSVERVPGDLFRKLRDHYGVDGVMFNDLTHYSPYRPVSLGVRSKLVDIESGRIHWASDIMLDSGNANVAASARAYQKVLCGDNSPVRSDGGIVLMSPRLFSQFAAFSNYASLKK